MQMIIQLTGILEIQVNTHRTNRCALLGQVKLSMIAKVVAIKTIELVHIVFCNSPGTRCSFHTVVGVQSTPLFGLARFLI